MYFCCSVTELYLSLNGYSSVDLPTDFRYQPLTKLHINSNKIKDWSSMCQLGQCFPNLENLVAMESELTTLISDINLKESFPCLKSFNLSKTKLSSWEDIEVFREFPALGDVRINDVPFLKVNVFCPSNFVLYHYSIHGCQSY
jgi:Leucine-rich repeat (LRR) protein